MDQTPQPMYQAPAPVMPPKSSKKKIIIWTLVAVVVLVSGYVAFAKYQNLWPFSSAVDISGWKTYTNVPYGFSLKLPPTITASESFDIVDNDQHAYEIVLTDNAASEPHQIKINIDSTIYVGGAPTKTTKSATMTVGGVTVQKELGYNYQDQNQNFWDWFVEYTFTAQSHSFDVRYKASTGTQISSAAESELDQIIETFQFASATSWKTDTDTQHGFEFQYPQDVPSNPAVGVNPYTTLWDTTPCAQADFHCLPSKAQLDAQITRIQSMIAGSTWSWEFNDGGIVQEDPPSGPGFPYHSETVLQTPAGNGLIVLYPDVEESPAGWVARFSIYDSSKNLVVISFDLGGNQAIANSEYAAIQSILSSTFKFTK